MLAASLVGCTDRPQLFGGDPNPTNPRAQLWTLFDLREALRDGVPVAPTESFPAGWRADTFLQAEGKGATLKVQPAFSEGEPAGYLATEIWTHFNEVWVQPWYFLVTSWNAAAPQSTRLKTKDPATNMDVNTPPLFDVGPDSKFYSPFWKIFYVVVPTGTPADKYTSVEQLLDDKLPIFPAQGFVYSVRPDDVTGNQMLKHPFIDKEIGVLSQQPPAYVDGQKMAYFVQGGTNFRFNDRLVVEEIPMFVWQRKEATGVRAMPGAVNVMGSVPLFSRRVAEVVGGRPRFGAYTRLHLALAPATAEAFDPDAEATAAATKLLMEKMVDPNTYRGRVALDRACFARPEFPASCTWLDAQSRIEDQLGAANLVRTEVTMCSAPVFFGGKGIGR